jgi:hypothetical protein
MAGILPSAMADETVVHDTPVVTREQVQDSIIRGLDWFASRQRFDGSWAGSTGVTGLVVLCFTGAGYDHTNGTVQSALGFMRNFYNPVEGSLADTFQNYETAIAIMAMSSAGDPQDADRLEGMVDFMERLQFSEETMQAFQT